MTSSPDCTVVRPGGSFVGRQGLRYGEGVSAESAGAHAICLHKLIMPPGTRAVAHLHEDHESAIHVVSGEVEFWWGPALEHHAIGRAGDFVHIPAGVPHLPANLSGAPAEVIVARTDPNEQESVLALPELDELPHLPPRATAAA